jgi:hypothetical protein
MLVVINHFNILDLNLLPVRAFFHHFPRPGPLSGNCRLLKILYFPLLHLLPFAYLSVKTRDNDQILCKIWQTTKLTHCAVFHYLFTSNQTLLEKQRFTTVTGLSWYS